MKIVMINGSSREGNTYAAVNALAETAARYYEVEIIESDKINIGVCKSCGACHMIDGCAADDDTNATVDKIVSADMIVFATPVYWFGMTAQMKLIIDKLYCRATKLEDKKIGIVLTGASPVTDPQYELINEQFRRIAKYLKWDIIFSKVYSATGKNDLSGNPEVIRELELIGGRLHQMIEMSYVICEGPVEYKGDIIESVHITDDMAYLISHLSKVNYKDGDLRWVDESSYGMCSCRMNAEYDRKVLTEIMELFKDKIWHCCNIPYSEEKKKIIYKNLMG